jgi:hypothetical protein
MKDYFDETTLITRNEIHSLQTEHCSVADGDSFLPWSRAHKTSQSRRDRFSFGLVRRLDLGTCEYYSIAKVRAAKDDKRKGAFACRISIDTHRCVWLSRIEELVLYFGGVESHVCHPALALVDRPRRPANFLHLCRGQTPPPLMP